MGSDLPPPIRIREAVNVADAIERDKLVRRLLKIRADAVESKATFEHWNRLHPDEEPLDTSWCDEVIAWADKCGAAPEGGKEGQDGG